jgi:hypothetical protein
MSVRKGTVAEVSGVEGSSESWKPLPFGMGAGIVVGGGWLCGCRVWEWLVVVVMVVVAVGCVSKESRLDVWGVQLVLEASNSLHGWVVAVLCRRWEINFNP